MVNDSGRSLPYMDWQNSPHVQIIEANQHERSVARNTGAAIARGIYLHFLDDDDWMAVKDSGKKLFPNTRWNENV